MNYTFFQNVGERRREFLNDIIKQGYDAYLYKTSKTPIFIRLSQNYKSITIAFIDIKNDIKYYIECLTNSDELVFKYFENEQFIDLMIDQIFHSHSLKMINSKSFLSYFKRERGNLLFKQNYNWETIEYAGLLIRHKFYHQRYTDFGTSNYIITILGSPIYFSPYHKKPFEFEFFHSDRTHFKHIFPKELLLDVDLNNYDGNQLIDLILEKAFQHFFDNKEFVVMNYDEFYYGKKSFSLPKELNDTVHVYSIDSLKFYTSDEDETIARAMKQGVLSE